MLGKTCDVWEGEGPSLIAGSSARGPQKRCVWKGLVLRARSEDPAARAVIEAEVTALEIGKAKPADLDLPKGTKVADAEALMPPRPEDAPPEFGPAPKINLPAKGKAGGK